MFYVVPTIPATLETEPVRIDFTRGTNTKAPDRAWVWLELDGGQKPFKFVDSQFELRFSHGHVIIDLKNTLNIIQ